MIQNYKSSEETNCTSQNQKQKKGKRKTKQTAEINPLELHVFTLLNKESKIKDLLADLDDVDVRVESPEEMRDFAILNPALIIPENVQRNRKGN